ncbi:MAG: glutamate synthase domain-containing protein 2 [Sulfurimonas sp.]|jgi:glutamate synthase domain-containing protein 2
MMSAGCIRARECSGAHGRNCPVGLATQDNKKEHPF